MSKKRIAILCGGQSAEHEVSLQSAKNVVTSIDTTKYEVIVIGIDKKGKWLLEDADDFLINADDPKNIRLKNSDRQVTLITDTTSRSLLSVGSKSALEIDIIFPVLHGPFGEDGSIQGLLQLTNIPFVGAGVLGSAIGVDKDVMKRLLRDAGIPMGKFLVFRNKQEISFEKVKSELGLPFFVKPANLGSSIGISKVHKESEYHDAINLAFSYDKKILIEEFIDGKEVFCAILGNEKIETSVLGELKTNHEFYDYDAKYVDEIEMVIPAKIPDDVTIFIQELAIKVAHVLSCEGMARVDFFVTKENNVYLNEINTIPGFTEHSWYPKLWEASGIYPTDLIDNLIKLAFERVEKRKSL